MVMEFIKNLDTPCVVIDAVKMRRNISKMQAVAARCGCSLRPHAKTHKSALLAKMQIDAGATGVTCAKTSEAEALADKGIDDIFVAYPLIGAEKLERALRITKKIKRFIVAVDSVQGARAMSEFAVSRGACFEARIEVDTGASRTGLVKDKLIEMAKVVRELPGIRVTGAYTYKSMVYNRESVNDPVAAGKEEGVLVAEAVKVLRGAGLDIRDISGGSTPTGMHVAETGLVNEIRPGTYIFHDMYTLATGACTIDDIAALVYATVVSTPRPDLAIVDAGIKTLSADVRLNAGPYPFKGFASVVGRDDLVLDRANEEHGMLRSESGVTGLNVGEVLALAPSHICPVINLQSSLLLYEDGHFREIPVDARGMVR